MLPVNFDIGKAQAPLKIAHDAALLCVTQEDVAPRIKSYDLLWRIISKHRDQRRIYIEKLALKIAAIDTVDRAFHQRAIAGL